MAVWLLYPVFVYSSLSPVFPLVVNLVVGACTLVLIGTLLTMPRVAVATFGFWSFVVPFVLPHVVSIDPVSVPGLLTVAAFWVPLGYSLAIWWVLRR